MKHSVYLLLLLLAGGGLLAQNIQQNMVIAPCAYDDQRITTHPADVDFYQTLDDDPFGPVDSSFCADFQLDQNDRYYLDLTTIDSSRALFVRSRPDLPLQAYQKYAVYPNFQFSDATANFSDTCRTDDCSTVAIAYQFEDTVTDTSGLRRFTIRTSDSEFSSPEACFTTERFERQELTDVITVLRIGLTGDAPRLIPFNQQIQETFLGFAPIDSLVFTSNQRSGDRYVGRYYEVVRTEDIFSDAYILPQYDTIFPGPDAIRYTEAVLRPNSDTVEQLEVVFEQEGQLALPPYTAFRGGRVAGSDSLRHQLTISFWDDFFTDCLAIIVELPVPPEVDLRFLDNAVSLANDGACLVLQPGAGLIVAEDSELTYGAGGVGQLAARQNARIELEENATLTLAAPVLLAHLLPNSETETTVDLQPGSLLRFTETSGLSRGTDAGMAAFLTVHLNGGSIDVSALSPAERQLIRYVYPPERPVAAEAADLLVYPNPSPDHRINLVWPQDFAGPTEVTVTDATGRQVLRTTVTAGEAATMLSLPTRLTGGLYWLSAGNAGRRLVGKFSLLPN